MKKIHLYLRKNKMQAIQYQTEHPVIKNKRDSLECSCEHSKFKLKKMYSMCDICSENDFLKKSSSNTTESSTYSDE